MAVQLINRYLKKRMVNKALMDEVIDLILQIIKRKNPPIILVDFYIYAMKMKYKTKITNNPYMIG